jgi:hypothetical protein
VATLAMAIGATSVAATSVPGIVLPLYRQAAIVAELLVTAGSTILNTAVVLRTVTDRLRIGLEARHAAIPSPIARPAPGNSLAARAAIWPAIGAEELVSAVQAERA